MFVGAWGIIAALGCFVLYKGTSLALGEASGEGVSRFLSQADLAVKERAVSLHMPILAYPSGETDEKSIPERIAEKALGLFPIVGYAEAKAQSEAKTSGDSTYELILAKEAGDENEVDGDGNLIAGEAVKEENEKAKAGQKTGQADGTEKKLDLSLDKLKDFDYLKNHFYVVDSSTTIKSSQLDVEKLLGKDMTIEETKGPQILIYHTHSQEAYKDSRAGKESDTVVGVGERLKEILEEEYGFQVIHNKGQYDVADGKVDRAQAYTRAEGPVKKILKKYPSIQVVIDLHRDGVGGDTHLVTKVNGKDTAQFMFFNGLSYMTGQGSISYLPNPYIEDNLALSLRMKLAAEEYYPGLARKTYLKSYRYNLHLKPKSMLIEVGAQTNTVEEAKNAMEPLADLMDKVFHGEE